VSALSLNAVKMLTVNLCTTGHQPAYMSLPRQFFPISLPNLHDLRLCPATESSIERPFDLYDGGPLIARLQPTCVGLGPGGHSRCEWWKELHICADPWRSLVRGWESSLKAIVVEYLPILLLASADQVTMTSLFPSSRSNIDIVAIVPIHATPTPNMLETATDSLGNSFKLCVGKGKGERWKAAVEGLEEEEMSRGIVVELYISRDWQCFPTSWSSR
jgi:hypothetical protein